MQLIFMRTNLSINCHTIKFIKVQNKISYPVMSNVQSRSETSFPAKQMNQSDMK